MPHLHNRREFIAGLSVIGATGLWSRSSPAIAEPPPETSSVRLPIFANVADCMTPMVIAEQMLHAEGIADVKLVETGTGSDSDDWLEHGETDFDWNYPLAHIDSIARGVPITVLAGLHVGCLELIASESVHDVSNLKGRKVGINEVNGNPHLLLKLTLAHIGLDPNADVEWVLSPNALEDLARGKIDAFMAGPPDPQIARARKLGHVILKTAVDRPWSQYYCCMLAVSKDYAENYPVATKRVLRALLKSIDFCLDDPSVAARRVVERGYAANYDNALQLFSSDARFDVWRSFDPEDSLRFYALRMKENGFIDVGPQEIIAKGTDWRFLNELKRELKT
jgi:NitT/TauT family transport system substrate-binding protein